MSKITLTTIKKNITNIDKKLGKFGNMLCDATLNTIDKATDKISVLNAHLKLFFFMLYYISFRLKIGQEEQERFWLKTKSKTREKKRLLL